MRHTKHWTAVSTLLGLISSAYCDLHHWRLNKQPQKAEPKLYCWAPGPHHTHIYIYRITCVLAGFSSHDNSINIYISSWSCHTSSMYFSLSLAIHPYHPLLPAGLLNNIQCPYRAVVGKFLLVGQHWHVRVKRSTGECHICRSLLLQQCPACFVHLIWMVLEIGCRWPYSCCFVECCFQNLLNLSCSILLQFLSSFFSKHFLYVHVVHPRRRTDTTANWNKLHFIVIYWFRGLL